MEAFEPMVRQATKEGSDEISYNKYVATALIKFYLLNSR